MLVFLAIVWWMDRYDREPLWLLLLTFAWGAIGSIGLALIGSTILLAPIELLAPAAASSAGAVLVAPIIEEPAKALILLAVLWNRHFDNMTDGFVYGAAAGLGFGMTENFIYFANVAAGGSALEWMFTVVIRTSYSAVMHATATAVVGAALGFARFRGCLAIAAMGTLGMGLAIGIHMLWNGLLTLDAEIGLGGAGFLVNLLLFPLEFLLIFAVYNLCLLEEKITIRRELREEAAAGLLPAAHAEILGSWIARNRRAWVSPGVDHHAYVYTATTLAFRKKQLATARPSEAPYYKREVEALRQRLGTMLAT